jgi:hypothetical protein
VESQCDALACWRFGFLAVDVIATDRSDQRRTSVSDELPLTSLSPGEYTLAIDVHLPDKALVTRTVPFEIKK